MICVVLKCKYIFETWLTFALRVGGYEKKIHPAAYAKTNKFLGLALHNESLRYYGIKILAKIGDVLQGSQNKVCKSK